MVDPQTRYMKETKDIKRLLLVIISFVKKNRGTKDNLSLPDPSTISVYSAALIVMDG